LLPVGGAFHSPLMEPARKELADAILATNFAKNAAGAALGQLNALAAPALAAIDTLAKSVKSAISFVNSLPGLVSGIQKGAAFTNTVNRKTLDAAMDRVIGSDLIKSPSYELPSASSLGISADIAQAKALPSLQDIILP
jgi:hypothetical protein